MGLRGRPRILLDETRVTRLGEGLSNGGPPRFAAVRRTLKAIELFRQRARSAGAREIVMVGTEALRNPLMKKMLLRRLQFPVRILSRKEEAEASFRGAAWALRPVPRVLVDVGGGSLEILVGRGTILERSATLRLGCVYLTERYLRSDPPTTRELARMEGRIRSALARLELPRARVIAGIGGSVAAMAFALSDERRFEPEKFHGWEGSREAVEKFYRSCRSISAFRRRRLWGIDPGRADVIVPAIAVLCQVLERTGADRVVVSTLGVRHGVLLTGWSGRRNSFSH